MSDKYKEYDEMTEEEKQAFLDAPHDPEDPRVAYDEAKWLEVSALIAERRALEQMARENSNTRPTPLAPSSEPRIGGFADTPDPRFPRRKSDER